MSSATVNVPAPGQGKWASAVDNSLWEAFELLSTYVGFMNPRIVGWWTLPLPYVAQLQGFQPTRAPAFRRTVGIELDQEIVNGHVEGKGQIPTSAWRHATSAQRSSPSSTTLSLWRVTTSTCDANSGSCEYEIIKMLLE